MIESKTQIQEGMMIHPEIRKGINKYLLARQGYQEELEEIKRNLKVIKRVQERWPELAELLDKGVVDFDPETGMLWTVGANPVRVMERPWGVEFQPCEYNHADGKFWPVWHCTDPWSAFYHAVRCFREGKTPFAFTPSALAGTVWRTELRAELHHVGSNDRTK